MQPKPRRLGEFISPAAFCHLAPRAAIIEAATRRDRREDRHVSRSLRGEDDERIASAPRRSIGQRLATLRATLHLPPPRVNIRAAYAAVVRKAVTLVTFAWRGRTRGARLDPAVGALRNTGLFVRPPAPGGREDETGGGEARLMPAAVAVTNPSQKQ